MRELETQRELLRARALDLASLKEFLTLELLTLGLARSRARAEQIEYWRVTRAIGAILGAVWQLALQCQIRGKLCRQVWKQQSSEFLQRCCHRASFGASESNLSRVNETGEWHSLRISAWPQKQAACREDRTL